jgi:fructokinase
MRPVIFGEVLFDRFPDGACVLGGAPFNVAWHLQAFGHAPLFVSRVGTDAAGERILEAMRGWGMDAAGVQSDPAHATGSVTVSLTGGEPHYDIVDGCAYDFIDAAALPALSGDYLVYHGSLALRHAVSALALAQLCRQTAAPRFVDINLRDPWWDRQAVHRMLAGARWLKLNGDELAQIEPEALDEAQRLQRLLGADTAFIALTRGAAGADIVCAEGHYQVRPGSGATIVDAVGAGDAFCSVLVTGVLRDWPLPLTLRRAQDFASAVVGIRGATIADAGFYRPFIEAWTD